ncbi:hypothetical protein IMCC3317_31580 [Kordia antarctica]|uniref:Uncharacterized protein n=1 Tax=Kordia antarctica TaxID=1218801 RepID=A0A7L4ZNK0_9FLAO|nr:hypothetical protein IMCC3317_31580 [Kordia antarctica]
MCVTLIVIQLFCLLFINTHGLIRDYYTLTNPDVTDVKALKIGHAIESSPIFKTYANYTGTDAGYGFYSPNVGSEFVMSFAVVDCDGKLLGEHQAPISLQQKESKVRFNLCTFPMMERIMLDEPNEIYDKYFEVMMHQIAKNINDSYETGSKVISEIYIHQPAQIQETLDGKTERLALLERYTFRF